MATPQIFEMNPAKEGLRFPTRAQVESIIEDLDTTNQGRTDISNYSLKNRYFPSRNILATELEMYAVQNQFDYGMTYFHTLNTEPRTVARPDGLTVKKTTWRGAHFKEAARWGESEILEISSMAPGLRPVTIQSEVADALVAMRNRRLRREEWLVAQILTGGQITVAADDADNPEGVAYTVDFQLDTPEITLSTLWDDKSGAGGTTPADADPIKFFHDKKETLRLAGSPYRIREVIVTPNFVQVLRNNDVFWDTWYKYRNMETETMRERTPEYMYPDEMILNAFTQMTGVQVYVYDQGFFDATGTYVPFIPDNHMTIIYDGPGRFGEFTYTAHVHSDSGNIRLGTGPYAFVNNQLKAPNPYYEIFHGFHGLPRLMDYDPKDLKNHRIEYLTYSA